jgi:hypothetical protein
MLGKSSSWWKYSGVIEAQQVLDVSSALEFSCRQSMLKLKQTVEEEPTVLKRIRSCEELDVEEMFLTFSTLRLLTKGSARDDARARSRQQRKAPKTHRTPYTRNYVSTVLLSNFVLRGHGRRVRSLIKLCFS